jgi:hypothetical protein
MENISELRVMLNGFIKGNKLRLTCFVKILISMCLVRTINLAEIAVGMQGKAKQASRYRSLQRFFEQVVFNYDVIARGILNWFFGEGKLYLAMDRTNWKWGKKGINILVLSVIYNSAAIPIFWKVLNKEGCTSPTERMDIVQRFIDIFGVERIEGLIADREFVGKEWFRLLVHKNIPFFNRIKDNTIVTRKNGKKVKIKQLFKDLKRGEKLIIAEECTIFNRDLYITGARSLAGDLMVVVSNVKSEDAIEIYLKRWQIETLFGYLKSKGFRFEDTHMTDGEKIEKVMALLSIGFCWALKTGEWRNENREKIKLKKHKRPEKSIFRHGLDFLREAILKISHKRKLFKICVRLFFVPPNFHIGKVASGGVL